MKTGERARLGRLARYALALSLIVFFAILSCGVQAQPLPSKRVLLISTGGRLAPGFMIVDDQILQTLRTITSAQIEMYAENLDIIRFPGERSQRIFREYLAEKYAEHPPDLIIFVFSGNLDVHEKELQRLFPRTPIVAAGLSDEALRANQFGTSITGFAQQHDPSATFELMLRLHPDAHRIVIVGGTAQPDVQLLQRTRDAAANLKGRVEVEFWDSIAMPELRRSVTELRPDSLILFTRMFRDAAGQTFASGEVGRWIGASANVPVYVLSDAALGTGAVGGAVASIEDFAKRAGELARRVLTGTPAASVPFQIITQTVPTFDWRALNRWKISETRLPPGSIVRYKAPSVWEVYRWQIVGALVIILLQAAMISALVFERRDRRRAEAELQENQQLMELAASAGDLGLWSRDLTDDYVWINASMRSVLGFRADEKLRFQDVFERVHPEDRARVTTEVERAEAAGLPFQIEFRTQRADGGERWFLSRGRSIVDSRGRQLRRVGVLVDITERKHAEQSLEEQRAFLRQVIDINPNFIFAKDREGRFTLANQAVADAYGVTVDELIGKSDADLNANAQEVEFFRRTDLEVMNTLQERFIAEERITDAHGNVRWLQTVKRPIVDPSGIANQVLGASTDITARKKSETELQKQHTEAAHVARVSIMGELSASLAHELNQPLTAILTNARAGQRFIEQEPVDLSELRGALADIAAACERAAQVVQRVKALLKKEESIEFATVDLASLIHDVMVLLRSDAVMQEVRITLELENDLPAVRGDRVQLQQVLLNIVINAFDAMKTCPAGERQVTVRALREDDMVCVAVSDVGTGLPGDGQHRLFEPFYTTKREGLGMGLPICRSIMEAHGGSLWAENNPRRGATFYFTIPIAGAASRSTAPAIDTVRVVPTSSAMRRANTIKKGVP